MALRGDLSSIKALKARIRTMPVTVAASVARSAAPAMTTLTTQAFESKRTVYGEARPDGVGGNALSLERTGDTRRTLRFTAVGTLVRCVLGTKYARYLIGKYGILPNGALPAAWSRRLHELVQETRAP